MTGMNQEGRACNMGSGNGPGRESLYYWRREWARKEKLVIWAKGMGHEGRACTMGERNEPCRKGEVVV